MSGSAAVVPAVERQDIHKSCRTIETLLGVLRDYCEVASAFAAIQKKLSKALKDAAGLKTNAQFAVNAFGASSVILEAVADINSKFAKIAEKESHGVSSEVKKWFKKLAKEEKAHDDRMNDSNVRIKQAGQAYEKKSKKGSKDANEEHARYINLLSVIGPEMSQEKFNHALHVTQQNTLVTFSVAASLARIADAEWTRVCESTRRISPTIGPLGQWRSLCEGAWTGPLPDDLSELSSDMQMYIPPPASEWGQNGLSTPVRRSLPVPPHSPGSVSVSAASSLDPPRSPLTAANQDYNQGSVNSITTLSAFPFPPAHLPVPLATNEAELQRQQTQLQNLHYVHSRAGSPINASLSLASPAPILSNSPKQLVPADLPESSALDACQSVSPQSPLTSQHQFNQDVQAAISSEGKNVITPVASGGDPKKPRRTSFIIRKPPPSDSSTRPVSPFKRAENSSAENEFGVHTDSSSTSTFKSHSFDAAKKNLERADSTQSAGTNVAALRDRYTRTVETSSHGLKDIPRLPMSVTEIASRYQSTENEPTSPRRTASPIVDRFTPTRDVPPLLPPASTTAIDENSSSEIRRRKQRIEELSAELDLKEKEYELRQREREFNQRTRDLEQLRDRRQFQFLSPRPLESPGADAPRGPRNSPFQHKRGSQSVTHVDLASTAMTMTTMTSSSQQQQKQRPSTSHHSPTLSQQLLPAKDHAPFCGCDTCSVSKYKVIKDVTSRDLRPPEPPILLRPEKPKGWIRRLSMPSVNVAFSLDAKKNASAISLKAGLLPPGENGRLRKRSFEQGVGNRTLTGIGR